MAGITNVDFSEYEITELGIRISPAVKADILKCVGKLEEELTSKTVQKKCGSKVIKNKNKRNGIRNTEIFGIRATGHAC